jgi:hypothetical protein
VLKKSCDTFVEAKETRSHKYLHSHECNINASIKLMVIIYAEGNDRGTLRSMSGNRSRQRTIIDAMKRQYSP